MAEGVSDDRLVPRLAIAACEEAVRQDAGRPRHIFQLGRALLSFGKAKEAAEHFRKAAEAGHAAAYAYLGDAYQFGHLGAVDYGKAYEAYGKAVELGFEPAKALQAMMYFDRSIFALDIVGELYDGNVSEISARSRVEQKKWNTRAYLFAFVQKLMVECDLVIKPKTVPALFTYRYGDGWTGDIDGTPSVVANAAAGEYDGQALLKRHGCTSPVSRQLFTALDTLLTSQ